MRTLSLVLIAGLSSACARAEASRPAVEVEMKNVDLHVTADITLNIGNLRGRFTPVNGRQIPYLDDPTSYAVQVDAGEVRVGIDSLNAIMARSLADDRSNVEKLRVSINDDGTLRQKGTIDSAINIPFNSKAIVSATPDGRIRISTKSVRGFGIPMKPVMKLFSIEMDDLVKVDAGRGVVVDGNDLILDPALLLPPPTMRGRLTAVRIEGNSLVQTFGTASKPLLPRPVSKNHIYWQGGQLSFGKLTMTGTDLELIDQDAADPFDFSVDRWNQQLVAGYSKTLPNRGLRAYMPDFNDLGSRKRVAAGR